MAAAKTIDSGAPPLEGTRMFQEAGEASQIVARQFDANRMRIRNIAARLRKSAPRAVVTGARGSSDNAATYAKYLIETKTGTLTSSASLSVSSVYAAQQNLQGMLFIAISQSGKSPDLLATAESAKAAGAFVLALVNDENSPLATLSDEVLPLHAGPERSVAATKTYIASVAALAQFIAAWSEDHELEAALSKLPDLLARAWALDWQNAIPVLMEARDLYVIGRGVGFGAAQEASLKFKETCGLHAEAFSAAEVRHGPMTLVKAGFPVLVLAQDDETKESTADLVTHFANVNAQLILAGVARDGATDLPTLDAHPALQPVLMTQSFYRLANALSLARGFDPDCPPHLNKVTETI